MTLLRHDQHTHVMKILSLIKVKPKPKTELMFAARFNTKQIKFYIDFLLQKQIIKKSKGLTVASQTRDLYSMTSKGEKILEILEKLQELLS